jgi:hypothetical protein
MKNMKIYRPGDRLSRRGAEPKVPIPGGRDLAIFVLLVMRDREENVFFLFSEKKIISLRQDFNLIYYLIVARFF